MKIKYLLIAAFLITMISPLFSESAALVLSYYEIEDEAVKNEIQNQIIKQIEKELSRQNLNYYDESYLESTVGEMGLTGRTLIDEANIYALGREADVPVVITIEATEQGNLLELIITSWDVEKNQQILQDRKVSRSSVTQYIMINSSIAFIVERLTGGESGVASITVDPKVRKITFLANQDGMEIYLDDGDQLLGTIKNSVLVIKNVEYEIGTRLLVTKKMKGYREAEQLIILDSEKTAAPLSDIDKAVTGAFELNWTYTQLMGLGAGIRYYPIPDWLYLSFDNYFYIHKDFSTNEGAEIVHNDFRFLIGRYIGTGPDSIFRVNVSLGLGFIVSIPLHRQGSYFDFYINPINISLELNFEKWSFYLRPELKFSIGDGENQLLDGGIIVNEYNIPSITMGVIKKW